MIAIKNWFLEKNHLTGLRGATLTKVKETEKAMLISYTLVNGLRTYHCEEWIPKSVIIDEWEKVTSNFGYHEYLEDIAHKAYRDSKLFEKRTTKSGRNTYEGDAFFHQLKTTELIDMLNRYNIEYMNREEWNNR